MKVTIGPGNFRGKGVYATRDFKKDEIVVPYNLQEITKEEFLALPKDDHAFVHSFWGKRFLFQGPSRYVNHAAKPTTYQDLHRSADVALHDIKTGDPITTNGSKEILNELNTFLENYESGKPIATLQWQKKGYRNAACRYTCQGIKKSLTLKRIDGNWQVVRDD